MMKGKLFDRDSNEELVGATIQIKSLNKACVTNEKGEFLFENLPEGKYTIHILLMGYRDATREIEVNATNTKTVRIEMEMKENTLHEVTVTAQSEARRLKDEGMPVTIINMSSLQGTVTSVSDILSRTVGVTVRSSGGIGSASRISVRGLEGKRIGFFIDDVPLNDQSDFIDLNDIPVDMIERIEIYKGVVPSRFGGSSIGGAVNLVIKEYPEKYMDVSYMLESFNTNKLQLVSKRNLKDKGIVFGLGGGYTYADNDYEMESPYVDGLKIKRNHDRFKKLMIGGSVKAKRWWFDEVVFEPVFIDTRKQIQGIETDIRKAETNSQAFLFANTLEKHDFLLPGLDFDLSSAIAYTKINLIDTAKVRYDWYGNSYPTPSKYGGELGNQYAANSNDKKFTFLSKLNLEYIIDQSHSVNFNSLFSLANGYPEDTLRDLSLNRKSVFDSKMRSWVGGLNYDFRTKDDRFMNSVTVRYYMYTMKTKKSKIYGGDDVKDIDLNKKDFGISNALRYRFTKSLMAKLSAGYDVRIPNESELLGDGYAISPSEVLEPERNTSLNVGLLFDRMGIAKDNLQIEVSFYHMYLKNMIRYTKGFIDAQYQNFGKMRTNGVEVDVKMDILPYLYGYCNVTYQDLRDVRETEEGSELTNPTKGKRMPNIPYLMGNAGLEFHKANLFGGKGQNTRIFTDASYIEEYFYDFEMTSASQRRIPSSLTFDLGIEHSFFNNSLYISGKLKNLTDKTVLSEFNRPLPGRSFGVKIRYIFK
jgi:outer membrane cobalamin receptor